MAGLVLEPREVAGRAQWRWLLRTEEGEPLASHDVIVPEGDYEFGGFSRLRGFLRWEADPGRRVVSEAELVGRVGRWIGSRVLGPTVTEALLDEAPVSVRVPVPAELEFLPYRPWEIATHAGRVLGREQVRFVFDLSDAHRRPRATAVNGRALRVLAVFSLPAGGSVLGLRRERYALQRLIAELGQGQPGRAIQLRVQQYGATRKALTDAVDDEDGWDVLHLSGHGAAGQLLLEREDGSADRLDAEELVDVLYPIRHRLQLVVLSACESGAATAAETLRQLSLPEQAAPLDAQANQEVAAGDAELDVPTAGGALAARGLGRAVVARLGCAVLAMRYEVVDEFAIELAGRFYRGLFEREQPVDVALARALPAAAPDPPSVGAPAVSLATPMLLGPAAGLRLVPPAGRVPFSLSMFGFPVEPPRFVGRTRVLARARHALLPGGGWSGVLLHGMAGAGKSTSAVELAYQTQATFTAAAFWTAPPAEQWATALSRLATALEFQLNRVLNPDDRPGAPMMRLVGKLTSDRWLDDYLPELTELVEQARLLLVLDNLESLLSPGAEWLDPRFGRLLAALSGHTGASRLVLTSRVVPAGLDEDRLLALPIHALSRDESLLLARELPHLRALQHDTEPAVRDVTAAAVADRALLARALIVVQGHPKLLELADAAAADPAELNRRVTAAEAAAARRGVPLAAFLRDGLTDLAPEQLLAALAEWTRSTTAGLPEPSRLLLQLLAAVEPDDRTSWMLDDNWADLWARLGRPGNPPALAEAMPPLVAAALVDLELRGDPDDPNRPQYYRIHSGVADTVRAEAPAEVLTAVDVELADYWHTVFEEAWKEEPRAQVGELVVNSALAAAPYLLRRQHWDTAGRLLEQALRRDSSPDTAAAVLPRLRQIAAASRGTDSELTARGVLAKVVARIDPDDGERQLRDLLDELAEADGQYEVVSSTAGDLASLLIGSGRLDEAHTLVDRLAELTPLTGFGPWTQLAVAVWRLDLVARGGDDELVLADVQQLRQRMRELPTEPGDNERVHPWNVRESILGTGCVAAIGLGRWQQALNLNAEVLASMGGRGAGSYEIGSTAFNDYLPLLRLGRLDQSDELLRYCQQVFEQAGDSRMLGRVLGARGDRADAQGHPEAAALQWQVALRYLYVRPNPADVAVGHYNLARCQRLTGRAPGQWLAHRLAAALLRQLTGLDRDLQKNTLRTLARDLTDPPAASAAPSTVDQVRGAVERVDGVRFGALVDALQPDSTAQQAALDSILGTARAMPANLVYVEQIAQWEPVLLGIVAATGGDQNAARWVDEQLDRLAGTADAAALVDALHRVLAGEREPDQVRTGLDPVDTAIVSRLLDALAGSVQLSTDRQDRLDRSYGTADP